MTTMGLPQLGGALKGRSLVLKVPAGLVLRLTGWSRRRRCCWVVVESARAMTTNEVLRLSGTQWLRQGLVAKRNGLD